MEEGHHSSLPPSRVIYARFLRAALEDDWKTAEAFIQENPNCLAAPITKQEGTALHNAAGAKRTRFVKELVKLMTLEQLELRNNRNCTALFYAAQSEIVTIAEVMVKKNINLPLIPRNDIQCLPLYAAIKTGNRDMVSYLYSVTPIQDLASAHRVELLKATISTDLYGMAYTCDHQRSALQQSFDASAHRLVDCLWEKLGDDDKRFSPTAVDEQHMMKLLVEATEIGNLEFLVILIRSYPDLIWQVDKEYGSLFHVAVKHRQERIFNLIYEIGVSYGYLVTFCTKEENSLLHLAGQLPSPDRLNIVSGAALQMQRELLWFQEIEKIVSKSLYSGKCEDNTGQTQKKTREMFVNAHKDLQTSGEKWMKDTANSCMLVGALIATMVFPAAFTVPGGNNQQTGIPIFLETNWFVVFFLSDAIAMLSSSSSILIFLAILTSRFTEKDFLISLPRRLALGLATLTTTKIGMLIAFTAACFLVSQSNISVPIRIIVVAPAIPISLFVILQYDLWLDIFHAAFYSNRFLFQSQNRLFKPASLLRKE
ncbi:hypothetical protein I3842_01G086000 [Carya illinoinensis]|uniref:PGG domain-containing protein n=1 Tax=Carya illinoinensis TaxID=32201 RepID=A0A922G1A9_CARIL|nr:hypothetical protein I3842_01G086000 [Carya illinoinensis]